MSSSGYTKKVPQADPTSRDSIFPAFTMEMTRRGLGASFGSPFRARTTLTAEVVSLAHDEPHLLSPSAAPSDGLQGLNNTFRSIYSGHVLHTIFELSNTKRQ